MSYEVTWVGDQSKDWGDDMRGYTISVKDESGTETRKVKLDRKRDAAGPKVGEKLEGTVGPHPRFNDASMFKEGAEAAPSGQTPPVGGAPASAASDSGRERSIERQVALKEAGNVTVALVGTGAIKSAEDASKSLTTLTAAGVKAIQGGSAEGNAESKGDDDIPF